MPSFPPLIYSVFLSDSGLFIYSFVSDTSSLSFFTLSSSRTLIVHRQNALFRIACMQPSFFFSFFSNLSCSYFFLASSAFPIIIFRKACDYPYPPKALKDIVTETSSVASLVRETRMQSRHSIVLR